MIRIPELQVSPPPDICIGKVMKEITITISVSNTYTYNWICYIQP